LQFSAARFRRKNREYPSSHSVIISKGANALTRQAW
jgi:hypothetical protein